MPLKQRSVVLGVSGSIAAYKAADLVSKMVQRGAEVSVVMTKSAEQFVGPLTFQTLTQRRVFRDQFDACRIPEMPHPQLPKAEGDQKILRPLDHRQFFRSDGLLVGDA